MYMNLTSTLYIAALITHNKPVITYAYLSQRYFLYMEFGDFNILICRSINNIDCCAVFYF